MKLYDRVIEGEFISRPNRFIAICRIEGREETCHVKNTGRCKELLVPGCRVILNRCDGERRKTKYDLVAVYKGKMLVNIDSQAPNKVFREFADCGKFIGYARIYPEKKFGNSRFDFYMEKEARRIICEIKGVTLEENGVCSFPDAPTTRGQRHVSELTDLVGQGYDCHIVFIVQMHGMKYLVPNRDNDPIFAERLITARQAGVKITALECAVSEDSMTVCGEIPVKIDMQ